MGYYPDFAAKLNRLLEEKERTAAWLARTVKVSPPTVLRWQSGEYRPGSVKTVRKIAKAFDLNEEETAQLINFAGFEEQANRNVSADEIRGAQKTTTVDGERDGDVGGKISGVEPNDSMPFWLNIWKTITTKPAMAGVAALLIVIIGVAAVLSDLDLTRIFSQTQSPEPTTTTPSASVPTISVADDAGGPPIRLIGYYESASVYPERNYPVTRIPAGMLTHVIYASLNVSEDGQCTHGDIMADIEHEYPGDDPEESIKGNFKQLSLLKQEHSHLKTLISIGGWDMSEHFSDAASSETSRQQLAESCIEFLRQYDFDGLETDWKYPVNGQNGTGRPEDKRNYTLLLAELRHQLDVLEEKENRDYLLTIAAPSRQTTIVNYELVDLRQYIDWFTISAYDYNGGWKKRTGFAAPLNEVEEDPFEKPQSLHVHGSVQTYLAAGVPASKLVLGVPFFGRGWSGVENKNHGLYQLADGEVMGSWPFDGRLNYSYIVSEFLPNHIRYWNDEARVPWLYNPTTGIMISYEDSQSLTEKVIYAAEHGLSGIAAWELSRDDDQTTLLTAVHYQLTEAGLSIDSAQ